MLTRQLLYTTMTRAVGTFIAVGQLEALQMAVATDKPHIPPFQLSQSIILTSSLSNNPHSSK
jgi:exodeoxyribonuclease V alpha subunit